MQLIINQNPKSFKNISTLDDVMEELGFEKLEGIAAAVNFQVIPKSNWGQSKIQDGDEISILQPAQGG